MNFEFVEFYPEPEPKKRKNLLGTVHIYAYLPGSTECQLDIRGIFVTKQGHGMYFNLPHFRAVDSETGEGVSFPLIRWTNPAIHKIMLDFLHTQVKPEIWRRIGESKTKKGEK